MIKLDNIIIMPASTLPFKEKWQRLASTLPKGSIVLCHASGNSVQTKILEQIEDTFKAKGRFVTNLAI